MVHETFKKIGYRNLIDMNLMTENPFIEQGVYINRPLRQIIDSLEITYKLDTIQATASAHTRTRTPRDERAPAARVMAAEFARKRASTGARFAAFLGSI